MAVSGFRVKQRVHSQLLRGRVEGDGGEEEEEGALGTGGRVGRMMMPLLLLL